DCPKSPELAGSSGSAGILARKALVELDSFCGLEVRAPADFSDSLAGVTNRLFLFLSRLFQ
ncbi:hypothetical protein L0222_21895, partial [bacterium]|nr:hypothetical protein [bacterium]